eukprot:CAMPEP_0172161844 /NCGR_PEP_ID=MMETSP1050-20130122/6342_1 /TAXON_ID=233186 /ORGANISM="Cryptomonas curvata, Strain CCAP979/52" /LENGTH=130 /DNA_ID=CAMNT_0012831769 /DNA_START=208 /DNA_END=596 /DNA_ORIENTATION=-
MVVSGGANAGFGQQSVNVFSSAFDIIQYAGGRGAGPMINDSVTPCRILAYVGQVAAFDVYAEDLNAGDAVRIYVLEDPGLPNGAAVTAGEPFQRCLPTHNASVGTGGSLGPCGLCQDSGTGTYGVGMVPA